MSPQGRRLVALIVCLLLLGLGIQIIRRQRLKEAIAAEQEAQLRELEKVRKQVRIAQAAVAESPVVPPEPPPAKTEDPALAEARLAAGLLKSGMLGQMRWPSIFPNDSSRPNTLAASMTQLGKVLALTDAETAALIETANEGIRQYDAAIAQAATVQQEGSTVTIQLNELTAAKAAYDHMQAAFADIMGPERNGFYEDLGAKKAALDTFNHWGMDGQSLVVSRGTPGGGPQRATIMFSRVRPQPPGAIGGPGGGGGAGVLDRDSLRLNVGPLEALLPADF